jgi:hypothetical protein
MSAAALLAPIVIEEEKLRADLRKIGLGARYHLKKFSDLEPSEAVTRTYDWTMTDDFVAEVFGGAAMSLHGDIQAHDLFMVLARATQLRGIKSKVINLSVLVSEVTGPEISISLLEARALFISPFYRPDYKDPLTSFQKLAVEDFLMDRLDNARAVFTLSNGTLQESRSWWSSVLVKRLQVTNSELQA